MAAVNYKQPTNLKKKPLNPAKMIDGNKTPNRCLSRVRVLLKGTVTVTNKKGSFRLDLHAQSVLNFSQYIMKQLIVLLRIAVIHNC